MADPLLSADGLSIRFGALQAVRDATLTVEAGEIHALIGPNGAGKTTLIRLLTGEHRPDAGSVRLSGRDMTSDPPEVRARAGLARTFQISALAMEHSVYENALLGALGACGGAFNPLRRLCGRSDLAERARSALDRAGIAELAAQRTADLSHGQRRKLEVAVALTLRPKIFLMDEPMAGLGTDGSQKLTGFLDRLRSEAPILLVEHDMDAVFALADRISVLVYGRIIATGTAAEIRSNPEVREAYLGEEATT